MWRHFCAPNPYCAVLRCAGQRLVEIIESTPLDDSSDIVIDNDFMPILKEVSQWPVGGT